MYEQSLIQGGLSREQAIVYETMVANGPSEASRIARKTPLSRPLVYRVLGELIGLGLADKKTEKGKVAVFSAVHPLKLKEFVGKKREEAEGAVVALEGILGKLTSDFNLASGKPGVRFFEGVEGVEYVLEDSLATGDLVYTYADIEAVIKYIPDINERYVQKREKKGVQKRVLLLDTPFARKFMGNYHPGITDARLISVDAPPFHSVMEIYNERISYITFSEERLIGVIIEDKAIHDMHKYLFEYMWEKASAPQS